MISAVEVYNKPGFAYREETFAILGLNARELLLKARLLKQAGNDPRGLRVYEARKTKAGKPSKKLYLRRNRSGNPQTISFETCFFRLEKTASRVAPEIKANLDALTAVRDNSIHYFTASSVLARQVQEVASASVKNFVLIAKDWFSRDLSASLHLMLPLSFIVAHSKSDADSVVVSRDEGRLIKHLRQLGALDHDAGSPFAVAVRLQLKLEKSNLSTASKVQLSKDPDSIKVMLSEVDIRQKYPWDYKSLCSTLTGRYTQFKQDAKFHSLRKPLLGDGQYSNSRFLDPGNPKSAKKDFYGASVLEVFDKHYSRK